MSIQQEFDQWAQAGKDRGMEERHWHTDSPGNHTSFP